MLATDFADFADFTLDCLLLAGNQESVAFICL